MIHYDKTNWNVRKNAIIKIYLKNNFLLEHRLKV